MSGNLSEKLHCGNFANMPYCKVTAEDNIIVLVPVSVQGKTIHAHKSHSTSTIYYLIFQLGFPYF